MFLPCFLIMSFIDFSAIFLEIPNFVNAASPSSLIFCKSFASSPKVYFSPIKLDSLSFNSNTILCEIFNPIPFTDFMADTLSVAIAFIKSSTTRADKIET